MKFNKTNIDKFLKVYNLSSYKKELESKIHSCQVHNNLKETKYLLYMTYIVFKLEQTKINYSLKVHSLKIYIDGFSIPCSKKCIKFIDLIINSAFQLIKIQKLNTNINNDDEYFISILKSNPSIFEKTPEDYLKTCSIPKNEHHINGLKYEILVTNELSKLFNLSPNNHVLNGPDASCVINGNKVNFEISNSVCHRKKSIQIKKWIDKKVLKTGELNIFIGKTTPQIYDHHFNLKFNQDFSVCKDENYFKLVKLSQEINKNNKVSLLNKLKNKYSEIIFIK